MHNELQSDIHNQITAMLCGTSKIHTWLAFFPFCCAQFGKKFDNPMQDI